MAVETRTLPLRAGDHVVQFYRDDADLARVAGGYVAAAVRAGEVAIVIATAGHRRAFERELEAAGLDLAAARRRGSLILLDAAGTLAVFTIDGGIDRAAFRTVIGGLVGEMVRSGRPVRAYGEMVALLWESGDVLGAIELETLWNELGRELPFSLFCAYPDSSTSDTPHSHELQRICELHSSVVVPAAGVEDDDPATAGSEVVFDLAGEPAAPGEARRLVRDALGRWSGAGVIDGGVIDDAVYVVSELATNAVRHVGAPFSVAVRLRPRDRLLRLSVRDASRTGLDAVEAEPGRGLGLVARLARDWGVEVATDGKIVWAELVSAGR